MTTTQNIYDSPEFFSAYSALPRSMHGLAGAPEWPTLHAMLPALAGLRVLDLGCGFGWFCRWAAEQGAARVFGIDVSERMLERARAETQAPAVVYERAISKASLRRPPVSISPTVRSPFTTSSISTGCLPASPMRCRSAAGWSARSSIR